LIRTGCDGDSCRRAKPWQIAARWRRAGFAKILFIIGEQDRALIVARQREQRNAHLRALVSVLEGGRFSQSPVWRDYIDFVRSQFEPEIAGWTAAVQGGRLRRVDIGNQHQP